MISNPLLSSPSLTNLRVHKGFASPALLQRLEAYWQRQGEGTCLSWHPGCLNALARGLKHRPYFLEVVEGEQTRGFLALAYIKSFLFGRFLVSLPYLNYGGVVAENEAVAELLIDKAAELADQLNVRYLELRHQHPVKHPALTQSRKDKVHMHLTLPATPGQLWDQVSAKVRNQVRKGQKQNFTVVWGKEELLGDFYRVFSENMRDLGTPVFSKNLFRKFLQTFPERAELNVVRDGNKPIAAAFLTHGLGISEVPSASSLRSYNPTCVNMLMYWHLLERTIQRGNRVFDFGRSSEESNPFRFKKQWGAEPVSAEWQYYVRQGDVTDTRKENPRYERFIRLWKRLPLRLTRLIGPAIVRGIP